MFKIYDEDRTLISCNKDDKVIEVLPEIYTINPKTFQFFNFNPKHFHIITSRTNSFYPKLPSSFEDQLLWPNTFCWYVNWTPYFHFMSTLMSFEVYIYFSCINLYEIIWQTTRLFIWRAPLDNTSLEQVCIHCQLFSLPKKNSTHSNILLLEYAIYMIPKNNRLQSVSLWTVQSLNQTYPLRQLCAIPALTHSSQWTTYPYKYHHNYNF